MAPLIYIPLFYLGVLGKLWGKRSAVYVERTEVAP